MRHLASNFMTRFKDKILKNLVCRVALSSTERKFNKHMATIGRINYEAQQWLKGIPFQLRTLSHDGCRRYGIMTTNISEVFTSVLKGARSIPFTVTHPYPLLVAGVSATPQSFPAVTSND